jgi:hypothetical protein
MSFAKQEVVVRKFDFANRVQANISVYTRLGLKLQSLRGVFFEAFY